MLEVDGNKFVRADCSRGLGSPDGFEDFDISERGKGRVQRNVVVTAKDFASLRVGVVGDLGSELLEL